VQIPPTHPWLVQFIALPNWPLAAHVFEPASSLSLDGAAAVRTECVDALVAVGTDAPARIARPLEQELLLFEQVVDGRFSRGVVGRFEEKRKLPLDARFSRAFGHVEERCEMTRLQAGAARL
jgi:hypothetical protein